MPIYKNSKVKSNINLAKKVTSTSTSISKIPKTFENYTYYQKVSFLPDSTPYEYNRGGHTNRTMYWVTDGGKRIFSSGRVYPLAGFFGSDYMAWNPIQCVVKPDLDLDDYIVDYAVGNAYAGFITSKGYVYTGGVNSTGELGHGDTTNRSFFLQVAPTATVGFGPGQSEKAKKIYVSNSFGSTRHACTYILTEYGNVYACGQNGGGQLADGTTTQRNSFVRCGNSASVTLIKELYVGSNSVGALRDNGDLYVWGLNTSGELGIGNTTNQTSAALSATNVKKVSHSWNNSSSNPATRYAFYINNDNKVFFTGNNANVLGTGTHSGLGNTTNQTSWTQVTAMSEYNIVDVILGGYSENASNYGCTWFLADTGEVFATGYNGYGQLGDGSITSRSTPVQTIIPTNFPKTDLIMHLGAYTADCIIGVNKESGRMWGVGSWNYGAVGYGFGDISSTWPNRTATSVRAHYPAREVEPPPPIVDGLAKFHSFYTGFVHEFSAGAACSLYVLCTDGTVWTKGYNAHGANGTGYMQRADPNLYTADFNNSHWRMVKF